MDKQKIIMVVAIAGWGLFAGTQITKTLLLGKLECPKCECQSASQATSVPVEVKK